MNTSRYVGSSTQPEGGGGAGGGGAGGAEGEATAGGAEGAATADGGETQTGMPSKHETGQEARSLAASTPYAPASLHSKPVQSAQVY